MAPKYTPLDMGFLLNQFSQQRDSIANTAALIRANSGWEGETLAEIAAAQKKAQKEARDAYNSAHKQTFVSSVFDLLSTPLFGVANAMDEALAGHQSDPNDSVLEDIGKTVGGVFTGLPKGLGAGLRGSTGILDVLPGVDINDEWQSNRTDKTHFSDVAIRKTTGMSTADAMRPENWEKIKPLLDEANNKSIWEKTAFEMAIPDDLSDPEAREEYFRNQALTGIASDVGGDPLNLLFFGGGSAARAAKASRTINDATAGLDAARASEPAANAILKGLNTKAAQPGFGNKFTNTPPPVSGVADNWRDVIPDTPISPAPIVTPPVTPAAASNAAEGAVTIGGKVRAPQSLAPIIATVDGIPEAAWLSAKSIKEKGKLTNLGIPHWMIATHLKATFGLKEEPIREILKHLDDGTEPTSFMQPPAASGSTVSPTPSIPAAPAAAISENVLGQAGEVARMVNPTDPGWLYRAARYLTYVNDGSDLTRTLDYLDEINALGNSVSGKEELTQLIGQRLAEDLGQTSAHAATSARATSEAASIPEGVSGLRLPVSSLAAIGEKGNFKTLKHIGRREKPIKGYEIGGKDQHDVAKRIIAVASSGDKNWLYKAADILREYPTMQWADTEKLLQKADEVIKKIGHRGIEGLAPALRKRIEADAIASKVKNNPEKRVSNVDEGFGAAVSEGKIVSDTGLVAAHLKRSEARIVAKIVRGFEKQVLGKAKAPGTGEGLARAIARGANVRYSGPQQVRMWNQITTQLKYANPTKYDKAVRILRAVENYYITKGVIPHSSAKTAESIPLRLSQVAEAIGPDILGKTHAFITGILRGDAKALAQLSPEQNAALQALRESESIAAAPAVQQGIRAGREIASTLAKTPASAARKKEAANKAIRDIREFVALKGGGDAGARIAGEHTAQLLGQRDAVNAALRSNRLSTESWLATQGKGGPIHGPKNVKMASGKGASKVKRGANVHVNDPQFVRSVTNAIARAANLPSSYKLGRLSGPAARVEDWLGARLNASYGVQDMRPIFLRQQASAMSTTGRRARYLNALARTYDPKDVDLWHEAFRAVQQNGVTSGRIAKLQQELAATMENLVGGTGLRSGAIADSTVVGRNRLLLDELNTNLKRFGLGEHAFKAAKVKDANGVVHDFSQGMDWIRSWEAWDVKNPYEFLHKFQSVIEFTVREKNMFDEVITRFASPAKHGDVKYGVNHPRLRGYYFTAEGASQAKVFVRMLEEVSTPNSKALQHFDHVLSKLKAALTIYIPGHHATNLIGSTYHNWIAGVNNSRRYEQAVRVIHSQKGRYGDIANFDKLAGPKALEQAVARSLVKDQKPLHLPQLGITDPGISMPAAGNRVIVKMKDGTKVTADMIYVAMFDQGILPSARVLEEVGSDVTSVLDKWRPLGGQGQRAVHVISEVREHIPRIALFIDRVAKHKGSFASAIDPAARAVRKWHPDGLDLTKFERNVMKRIFPFYSWTRKAIPLAIEATIFAGPKVMAYPRLMEAIALANGIDPADRTRDPFPNDQMFPDWLRDRGIGPVAGAAGSYRVINPSTPIIDTLTLLGHPGQSSIDMLNPMIKVPIETNQGATLGRQIPIGPSNEAWMDYGAKQIPIVSQAGRASGQFGVSESTKAEGFPNWTNIVNLITGAKAVDTGKYQKSSQFDLREYLKQKKEQQGR